MAESTTIQRQNNTGRTETVRATQSWTYRPDADVIDLSDAYKIILDVPGASRDNIDLSVERGVLSLQATVANRYAGNTGFRLQEFGVGNYHRRFRVGDDVDVDNMTAEYDNGVLTVTLPKTQQARRRQVPITAA